MEQSSTAHRKTMLEPELQKIVKKKRKYVFHTSLSNYGQAAALAASSSTIKSLFIVSIAPFGRVLNLFLL